MSTWSHMTTHASNSGTPESEAGAVARWTRCD